jgi:hypothetical protein
MMGILVLVLYDSLPISFLGWIWCREKSFMIHDS